MGAGERPAQRKRVVDFRCYRLDCKKYKKSIKINDLSDKQFDELMTALKKAIEGESGE